MLKWQLIYIKVAYTILSMFNCLVWLFGFNKEKT